MTAPNGDTYGGLREAILSFALAPGERLSERGLEPLLGASRTPIRAALMRLENEGLTQRAGRGWQVTPIDLSEVRAVMEYREAIETASVALAVERAEDEELAALRVLTQSTTDDEETGLRDGADFHTALARLSRNRFLAEAMEGALTRLSRTRWLGVRTPESRLQARTDHLEIIAAVRSRDREQAIHLVTAHGRATRDRLLQELSSERRRLRGHGHAIIDSSSDPSTPSRPLAPMG